MKNLGKIIFAIFFLFLTTSPTLAVNEKINIAQGTAKQEATQGAQKKFTLPIKNGLEEKVATFAGKLDARKKEIIRKYFGFISRRLQAASYRLSKIIIRIEARIEKIEKTNTKINLSTIKIQLGEAKKSLNNNNVEIKAIQTQMETIIEENNSKEGFTEIRTRINKLKKSLLETRKILIKIIGDIKGLRVGQTNIPLTPIKEVE